MPKDYMSTGRALLLRFRSDDNINSKGFSVAYNTRPYDTEDTEGILDNSNSATFYEDLAVGTPERYLTPHEPI